MGDEKGEKFGEEAENVEMEMMVCVWVVYGQKGVCRKEQRREKRKHGRKKGGNMKTWLGFSQGKA